VTTAARGVDVGIAALFATLDAVKAAPEAAGFHFDADHPADVDFL
jgi:hypothetical protein